MTLLARWRTPAPARINDVAIYEECASSWWSERDPVFAPLRAMAKPRLRFLARHDIELEGRVVVDVGAGGGFVALPLAAGGARVIAVDLAPSALTAGVVEGRRRGLILPAVAASAEAIPLASACAHLVVCTDVLVHVPNRARALDEITRLCAPGGHVYIATMNRTWLARLVLVTLGEDILGIVARGTHDPATFIRPGELDDELSRRGLGLVAREGVGPVGAGRRGLTFGRSPTTAVMYHALFQRPSTMAAETAMPPISTRGGPAPRGASGPR